METKIGVRSGDHRGFTVAFEDRATYIQTKRTPNRSRRYPISYTQPSQCSIRYRCRYHCASPNAEDANVSAHSKSSYSSRSCMKLLTAVKACLSASWFTSMPSFDIPSLPTLTRPSILDRPGRQVFAIRQRLLVELTDGHDGEISLLSRRTVRALRTFRKILHQHGQRLD